MTVLVEARTLKSLLDRLKSAENLISTLSDEVKSIKQVIFNCQADGDLLGSEFSRPFSTSSGKTSGEDLCDNPSKRPKYNFNFDDDYVVVYTDGACEKNGKVGAKAGIGVWFGDDHPLNISKPVTGKATNNTAEIQACIAAVNAALANDIDKLKIVTDSEFTINCITKWMAKWKRNNWVLSGGGPVKNKEDLMKLDHQSSLLKDIKWEHIAGHRGHKGNEEADALARQGAKLYRA